VNSGKRVREISEFDLIRALEAQLPSSALLPRGTGLGIGDDAAVWTPRADRSLVVTSDALVEGVHFHLEWTDWTSLGHKMLAVNLSDIAAMGAVPRLAIITLGLTGDELVSDVESLYLGCGVLAGAYGVAVAGGDVVRSPGGVSLGVTVIGDVKPGEAIVRSGSQPGDLVVVSGTLGASAAGMAILERGSDHSTTGPLLVAAHLRPTPRIALGQLLCRCGVTAGMDLSDGLLGDLPKILEASGVAAIVDVDAVPILPAVRALFPEKAEELALRGGEDYELLLTVPAERFDRLKRKAASIAATLTPIGRIVERGDDPQLQLTRAGEPMTMPAGGFDHFGA
jgi:thiamine-monophosphate kinase